MPSPLVPADNIAAALTKMDDGDRLKSANLTPTIQGLADREEAIRLSLLHAATAQLLTTSRDTTDGIKRLRFLTSAAALSALVVGAANDREVALINDGSSTLAYQYDHGNAATADGAFVLTSAGGRWFLLNSGLKGTIPGYPFTAASGKLTGPSKVAGAIKEYTDLLLNPTAVALVAQGAQTDSAVFVDPLAGAIFNIPNVEIGDILDITLTLLGVLNTANLTAKGNVLLRCGPTAGPFTDLHNVQLGATATGNQDDLIVPIHLQGRFVAASAGNHTVKPVVSTDVGGATRTLTIFSPMRGLVKRIEP
jgi:hypothetical protein